MESPRSPIKAQENKVELIGTYGGDLTHSMSAWTSTSRDIDVVNPKTGKTKRERIPSLLRNLAENGHGTPFEKSAIHFLVTTDIATHIQLLKHLFQSKMEKDVPPYLALIQYNFNDKDTDNLIEHFRDKSKRKEFFKLFNKQAPENPAQSRD